MNFIFKLESFDDLRKNLELCDQLFLDHQVLLMHDKIESAQELFEKLYIYRTAHLNMMENTLVPVFRKALFERFPEGAKPLYFTREKVLMQKELDGFIKELGNLVLHAKPADIVTMFEEYAAFKDLADHHDAREKEFLYPVLEEKLAILDKEKLLKEISEALQQ